MAIKLSNVIGAPFSDYVLKQLHRRAIHNSSEARSNQEILFLANKMAWVRLASSVNVVPAVSPDTKTENSLNLFYGNLGLDPAQYPGSKPDSLAKNWVLQAGTSVQDGNGITLRQGIGLNGAYGLGGTTELGYRPMPGLTSVTVETAGRLGSLRQATIDFKVWNMTQLNVIEALYFRLGYSMLLEWGHVQYYTNNDTFQRTGIYGINDPFAENQRKETIQQAINRKAKETDGNYDGMLGIVSNFNWTFNQDGGYDCRLSLVGLGAIMDTLRINQSYTLPNGLFQEFKQSQDIIDEQLRQARKDKEEADRKAEEARLALEAAKQPQPPTNKDELYTLAQQLDSLNNISKQDFLAKASYYIDPSGNRNLTAATPDYYYESIANNVGSTYTSKYFGLFLTDNTNDGSVFKRTGEQRRIKLNKTYLNKVYNQFWDYTYSYEPQRNLFKESANQTNSITGKSYNAITRFFYATSGVEVYPPTVTGPNTFAQPLFITIGLDSYFNKTNDYVKLEAPSYNKTIGPDNNSTAEKLFYFKANFSNSDDTRPVTRKQVLEAFDAWLENDLTGTIASITPENVDNLNRSLKVEVDITLQIPNVASLEVGQSPQPVTLILGLEFNNTFFISEDVGSAEQAVVTQQQTEEANEGDTSGDINESTTSETDSADGFRSALHAMLRIVQTKTQAEATKQKTNNIVTVNIQSTTEKFFQDGVLNGVLNAQVPTATNSNGVPFSVLDYALKGYNGALMSDPTLYNQTPTVSFKNLCQSFLVRYSQGGLEGTLSALQPPVYIQFGYLLAFLNSMCLIYDSTQKTDTSAKTDKRPYIYIDFNPDTNFCLTSPQQFSINPFVCLIPFNGTLSDYENLFPAGVKFSNQDPIFNPKNGVTTTALNSKGIYFQAEGNPYKGKIMSILLNVQYLIDIIDGYVKSDNEHAVNLQPFLERILVDVNKVLGGINSFRVSYKDESNVVQIRDDQWVPDTGNADDNYNMLVKTNYGTQLKSDPILSGQLPVFGSYSPSTNQTTTTKSLTRQYQIRSVMSTKLASMIAISAQAATASVNAKDHTSLSYLNQNYQDRYKPFVQNPPNNANGSNANTTKEDSSKSNNQKTAELFNEHVRSIYQTFQLVSDKIEAATNYYIECMSREKAKNPITVSAPFIPVELDLTLDGISGIIMGNAFTIPENRLPLSLRGEDGIAKIAFIVTGLSHTIESNEWLTRIKGQMIKLRSSTDFGITAAVNAQASANTAPSTTARYPGACDDYSGVPQVLAPNSVNTQNFKTYYPNYTFVKGKSDIVLPTGLTPLTEVEIIDDTTKNRFNIGTISSPVPYFIIHHTAGRGTADDVYTTFYCRGFPAHYVIDRSGKIHRFLPDGAKGQHVKNWNSRSIGVEIVANNDSDVLPIQVNAAIRLAQFLGFKIAQVIGHGKVQENKLDTEGFSTVKVINPNYTPVYDPNFS